MTVPQLEKIYLGDGAYAALNDYGDLVLTTENGYSAQNTIVLEPEFFQVLEAFIEQARTLEIGRWRR